MPTVPTCWLLSCQQFFFWGIDAYYLREERLFRALYDACWMGTAICQGLLDGSDVGSQQSSALAVHVFRADRVDVLRALHSRHRRRRELNTLTLDRYGLTRCTTLRFCIATT